MSAAHDELEQPAPHTGITLRAVILGFAFALFVDWLIMYSVYRIHSSWLVFGHMPVAVLMPFVVIALVLNPLLKRYLPSWRLNASELAVMFVMGLIAAGIPEFRLVGYFLSVITYPIYYASPENRWGEYLLPHIRDWLVPSNETGAIGAFWNGLPEGASIPWSVWVVPVFWWSLFLGALFIACAALMVIFRKQWEEHERLLFPLAEVPLAMVAQDEGGSVIPRLLRSKVFWVGFGIPLAFVFWNMITYWVPLWPRIRNVFGDEFMTISFGPNSPQLRLKLHFFILGFAYLASLDVLLSVWLFYVLTGIEITIFNIIGFKPTGGWTAWSSVSFQSFGALTFLVLSGIWLGRKHLKGVFAKALGRGGADDSQEYMSYRLAVWSLVAAVVFMVLWLVRAGMSLPVTLVFLGVTFISYLGASKLIAQTGLVYLMGTVRPQIFSTCALGTTAWSGSTWAAMTLTYTFSCDGNPYLMPNISHAARITRSLKGSKRGMFWLLFSAAVVTFLFAVWYTLYMGYTEGASNLGGGGLGSAGWFMRGFIPRMENPQAANWTLLVCYGVGFVVTGVLTVLRYFFVWWPLHPVGLAIAFALPVVYSAFSVFLAWLIKLVVLKVGGITAYRKTVPAFLGMVVGYVTGVGISMIVDVIFFMGKGHEVHVW